MEQQMWCGTRGPERVLRMLLIPLPGCQARPPVLRGQVARPPLVWEMTAERARFGES